MSKRASYIVCLHGVPIARPVNEPLPQMLVVACENYMMQEHRCRGMCAIGHTASVEACEACADWEQPQQAGGSIAKRVGSFTAAMASMVTQPSPSAEAQEARLAVCRSCPHFMPSDTPDLVGHCKACGCGVSPMSSLRVKASIARSSCPHNLWQ